MKISYNWLSEYVAHEYSPEDLAHALTMSGLEVEEILHLGPSLDGVFVGRVVSVRPHPNADRLTLCDIDLGTGELIPIVCGAPNVATDQRVPVATIGTHLTIDDKVLKIKKSKIRGQTSMGMICAEDELGLSDDHSGIMVLSENAVIGEPLLDYMEREGKKLNDTVLDIAITPNRADATSHIGVARDVSALQNVPLKRPEITIPSDGGETTQHIKVDIECPDLCRRYAAVIVTGVKVGPSPAWLKQRLEAIELRSINNVVDATNYVMYECGQPLHAFDYDRIAEQRIVVRESVKDEEFTTLDGKKHLLPEGVVLICDGERPVAIGGIMGGENSEVDETTSNVLIEGAWFCPSRTRKSARALGMSTDASYRFERGVDTDSQAWATVRVAALIAELGGGSVTSGIVDAHPRPPKATRLDLRVARVPKILGIRIPRKDILRILTSLGFDPQEACDTISCTVPSYRPDIHLEIDLIEEIARIYGFHQIKAQQSAPLPVSVPVTRPIDLLRERVHAYLNGHGFREIYTNSLLPDEQALQFSQAVTAADYPPVRTLNAVSRSMATLRPSLLPGMLNVMQHNANHGRRALRFYEFGHVFHLSGHEAAFIENYSEYEVLLFGISGPVRPQSWNGSIPLADFFDIKGDVEKLLSLLNLDFLQMEPSVVPTDITAHHITLSVNKKWIGTIARLSDEIQAAYDLPDPVFFATFNWTRLALICEEQPAAVYSPVPRYPVVERDIAMVVDSQQPVGDMIKKIREAGRKLLKNVDIFDIYTGKGIAPGKKSVAFSLRFGANRTLRDQEIDHVVQNIVTTLSAQFDAELRA